MQCCAFSSQTFTRNVIGLSKDKNAKFMNHIKHSLRPVIRKSLSLKTIRPHINVFTCRSLIKQPFEQARSYSGVWGVTPPDKNSVGKSPNLPFLSANVLTFLHFWSLRRRIRCYDVTKSSLLYRF